MLPQGGLEPIRKERFIELRASNADLQTYLPCALMTKVDIASMAHSLEARQPFLDYRLVEWAAALPSSFKLKASKGNIFLNNLL